MVLKRILKRLSGRWRRQRKDVQEKIRSRDRNVAANETLSESDSQSVDSVYLIESVSVVSGASQSIEIDAWSYTDSVVRYSILLLIPPLTHLYFKNLLIRFYANSLSPFLRF
jgi:hypothetical protein